MSFKPLHDRESARLQVIDWVEGLVGRGGELWAFHPKHLNIMVSSLGRVKILDSGRILSKRVTPQGYVQASIPLWDVPKTRRGTGLHRLVCETFFNYLDPQLYEANHIDGDKSNNSVWNVNWLTRQENLQHARETGLFKRQMGEANGRYKYSNDTVRDISESRRSGIPVKEIAKKYNVGISSIYHVLRRRT